MSATLITRRLQLSWITMTHVIKLLSSRDEYECGSFQRYLTSCCHHPCFLPFVLASICPVTTRHRRLRHFPTRPSDSLFNTRNSFALHTLHTARQPPISPLPVGHGPSFIYSRPLFCRPDATRSHELWSNWRAAGRIGLTRWRLMRNP